MRQKDELHFLLYILNFICQDFLMLKKLKKIFSSKSKFFAILCFAFLVGVTVASFLEFKINKDLGVIIFGLLGCLWIIYFFCREYFREKYFWTIRIAAIFTLLLIGMLRYIFLFPENTLQRIEYYAPNKVEIIGVIATEPDMRLDSARYVVETYQVVVSSTVKNVSGRVYVKSDRYPHYNYGDQLKIKCALEKPEPIVDETTGQVFRYDLYLALQKVFAICNRSQVNRISSGNGDYVFTAILQAKSALANKISDLWPEPEASFMAGLLYGYRGGLGELNELFSRTGVTHIVAVSGFNISVIATILITAAVYARIQRQKAFWLVSVGIVGFVIFTGASASVVRAGVMGIIALLAKHVGRMSRIGNVMLVAAVIMVLQNPLVLWHDAGFQLSFLSTLGLVYVAPLLQRFEKYFPEFLGLRENIVSTLAAIISTLPLILYQFGRLSLVAPIVNVLILWLISWLMLAGTVAVVVGAIIPGLGIFIAWPAHLGMQYIITVVSWFAGLSFASVDIRAPAWLAILVYILLLILIFRHNQQKIKSGFNGKLVLK